MMRITVIVVGKLKEKFYSQAIQEFQKRLSAYVKLDIIEIKDEKTNDKATENENILVLEKEAKCILTRIKDDDFVVALAIEGKMLDSVELSTFIDDMMMNRVQNLIFLIGGSLGLHESVLKRANVKLSFSKMTFPHQLMRVILLEQIYRAFKIIKNEPYHK